MTDTLHENLEILVVDDHALIREALRNVLKQLGETITVIEAETGADALRVADSHPDLDVCLLDLNLPDGDGFSVLAEFRDRHPAVAVVMLSASDDRDDVTKALDCGASGFIPKSSPCSVMLSALNLVLAGGVYLPREVLAKSASKPAPRTFPRLTAAELGLTERQLQVLALIAQGKSNKTICRELGLAEGTVKIHVTAILKALHATSRTQAVVAASQLDFRGRQAAASGKA